MTLKPEYISVSHRLPGRSGSTRPIIVKFVRRNTKTAMMKSKRKLRDANRKGVYINDDLTPLVRDANRKGFYINDDLTPLLAKMARIIPHIIVTLLLYNTTNNCNERCLHQQ